MVLSSKCMFLFCFVFSKNLFRVWNGWTCIQPYFKYCLISWLCTIWNKANWICETYQSLQIKSCWCFSSLWFQCLQRTVGSPSDLCPLGGVSEKSFYETHTHTHTYIYIMCTKQKQNTWHHLTINKPVTVSVVFSVSKCKLHLNNGLNFKSK